MRKTSHSTDDIDAMQRCVERALAAGPPDDPSDSQYNARYRGMAMALHLNDAGKRDTCVKLCDTLLRYPGAGDFLEPQLQSIRTGQPKSIDPASLFDPFDKIDLKKLREQ